MTYFSIDVESTGLVPFVFDVTSLSVVEVDTANHFTCRLEEPEAGWNWDPATVEWAKDNLPDNPERWPIHSPQSAIDCIRDLLNHYPKPWLFVAWPASFDYPCMQSVYNRAGIHQMPFNYRTIDIKSWIAGQFNVPIDIDRDTLNETVGFSLYTEPNIPHDPYYDALEQAIVFKRCLEAKRA